MSGPYFHGSRRAGGYTQFTDAALFLIKNNRHLRSHYGQCPGGAHGCAGTALGADVIVAFDFLRSVLYINTLRFEVFYTLFEIFSGAGQLQYDIALFAGEDAGSQDVEGQVVFSGQGANQWFLNFSFGKT